MKSSDSVGASTRLTEIDWLRGLAILMVWVTHCVEKYKISEIFHSTQAGVELFFVISGFVVARTISNTLSPMRPDDDFCLRFVSMRRRIGQFYVRRIFRIAPLAFVGTLIPAVVALLVPAFSSYLNWKRFSLEVLGAASGVYNYTLASEMHDSNLAVYWSLAVEEQYYLIAPIVFVGIAYARSRFLMFTSTFVLLALVVRPFFMSKIVGNFSWTLYRAPTHLAVYSLVGGMIIQCAFEIGLLARSEMSKVLLKAISLYLLLLLVFSGRLVDYSIIGANPRFGTALLQLPIVLSAMGLVTIAAQNRGVFSTFGFSGRIMLYLGQRSYAIYLVHVPIMALQRWMHNQIGWGSRSIFGWAVTGTCQKIALSCASLGLILLISESLHHLIEKPLTKAGYKMATRLFPDLKSS